MKLTILCENTVGATQPQGLISEHGLSFLIEDDYGTTLYDTGQGPGLINNMNLLKKNPGTIDRLIISHGHYDHTGGLMDLLQSRQKRLPVYLHKDAFLNKFAELPALHYSIGFQHPMEAYEKAGADFIYTSRFQQIHEGIYALSDVERPDGWLSGDPRLKCEKEGKLVSDSFNDDLSLLVKTNAGPVILLGCAHAGIVEILEDFSHKSGYKAFYGVLGGTHLASASEDYVSKTINALKKFHVQVIGTSHCTGFSASATIMKHFPDNFVNANVGCSFSF